MRELETPFQTFTLSSIEAINYALNICNYDSDSKLKLQNYFFRILFSFVVELNFVFIFATAKMAR
jgi:hypothetical protein